MSRLRRDLSPVTHVVNPGTRDAISGPKLVSPAAAAWMAGHGVVLVGALGQVPARARRRAPERRRAGGLGSRARRLVTQRVSARPAPGGRAAQTLTRPESPGPTPRRTPAPRAARRPPAGWRSRHPARG